jgi:stage V sporulation protein SpoVS
MEVGGAENVCVNEIPDLVRKMEEGRQRRVGAGAVTKSVLHPSRSRDFGTNISSVDLLAERAFIQQQIESMLCMYCS